jgi:hypothetical protein
LNVEEVDTVHERVHPCAADALVVGVAGNAIAGEPPQAGESPAAPGKGERSSAGVVHIAKVLLFCRALAGSVHSARHGGPLLSQGCQRCVRRRTPPAARFEELGHAVAADETAGRLKVVIDTLAIRLP